MSFPLLGPKSSSKECFDGFLRSYGLMMTQNWPSLIYFQHNFFNISFHVVHLVYFRFIDQPERRWRGRTTVFHPTIFLIIRTPTFLDTILSTTMVSPSDSFYCHFWAQMLFLDHKCFTYTNSMIKTWKRFHNRLISLQFGFNCLEIMFNQLMELDWVSHESTLNKGPTPPTSTWLWARFLWRC